MQFEDFDNKIKQAADQHHPNYDETAWAKMEKLLDRHMPQNNDGRRRIIFFLLCFLFLGGGAFILVNKPWQQNKPGIKNTAGTTQTISPESSTAPDKDITGKSPQDNSTLDQKRDDIVMIDPTAEDPVNTPEVEKANIHAPKNKSIQKKNQPVLFSKKNMDNKSYRPGVSAGDIGEKNLPVTVLSKDVKNKPSSNSPGKDLDNPSLTDYNPNINDIKNKEPELNNVKQDKITPPKEDAIPTGQADPATKKKEAKNGQVKKTNSFFFSISAGPDINSVGMDDPGKVKLLTGAGFGYSFRDKWILRTGFYAARKIYTAKPGDYKTYNPPSPFLTKVDADCRVYEIPLSIAYNFSRSEKNKAFASVGLSSYLMRKETYKLLYTYPGTPPNIHTYTYNYNNENKHYFSVLTLSGGYQRKLSRTFAFMVEPYLKIPMKGVGHGKVKLNSAGILLSVNISPFNGIDKK